ncbi:MAG: radical SAM protein [Candidatus Omnitrophica bacterium]|nr:radical SAM protein [Candidatus Omnitrophota bacterium]
MFYPQEVSISVTDRCNLKCRMCNIWAKGNPGDFDATLFSRMPPSVKSITISGGEPFLRDDLHVLVRAAKARCPRARIVITTNATLTVFIERQVREILKFEPKLAIRISFDGREEMHDYIRGSPGAYKQALESANVLKRLGLKDLDFHITLTNENAGELPYVYELSKKYGVLFNCQVAHSSDLYFRKDNEPITDAPAVLDELEGLIRSELKKIKPYGLFKTYYYKGIWDYMNKRAVPYGCKAGDIYCYIDSRANVYPCVLKGRIMGNLKDGSLCGILNSPEAEKTRKQVSGCSANCWLICTAAPVIKKHPLKAFMWILKNKPRAHLGLKILK